MTVFHRAPTLAAEQVVAANHARFETLKEGFKYGKQAVKMLKFVVIVVVKAVGVVSKWVGSGNLADGKNNKSVGGSDSAASFQRRVERKRK